MLENTKIKTVLQNLSNKTLVIFVQFFNVLLDRKNLPHIAIDISSGNIRILKLSTHKNNYHLENIICEPIIDWQNKQSHNKEKIIFHLKKIVGKNTLKSCDAAIAISYSEIIAKNITLPQQLKENEIEEFLTLNIEQYINVTADKIIFDHHASNTNYDLNQPIIKLVAARKENIARIISLLTEVGITTKIIAIDAHALARASTLLELDSNATSALINLENGKILIVICHENKLIYAQEYLMNSEINAQQNPQSKYPEFIQTLANQISNNLQLCLAAINQPINTIVLCGTYAHLNGLAEFLQKISHIKTILANPFGNMTFAKHLDKTKTIEKAAEIMLCCGLALWDKHSFNLSPCHQELRNEKQKINKPLIGFSIILGILLITIVHIALKQKINLALATQHQLLPQITALQQQENQVKITTNKIAEIKAKIEKIKTLQNAQTENIELLTTIGQITPPSIYLLNLQKNNDVITINGQTNNLSAITEFMQRMTKINSLSQVQIQEIKNISEQEKVFTIIINLKQLKQ